MWAQEHCQDSQDTRWISCVARLSWHDNRWWSTSYSLESRPLKSLTSRLFVDRDDEEEPRAIRERWSVFINSVLENFPPGAEDRPTSGWEENRGGPSWRSERGKMKERNGRTRESSMCLKIAAGCACKSLPGSRAAEWRNLQFTRRSGAARETAVFSNGVISLWDRHCVWEIKTFQFSTGVQRLLSIRGLYEGISRYWMASSLGYISLCLLNCQLKSIPCLKGARVCN